MLCYQGLASQKDKELTDEQKKESDNEEKELREVLKNADANLIVFDELHRSGAKTWKGIVKQLINSNEKANILGITATPIRDGDHVDMMRELAEMTNTYTEEELATKQYLGYEMYLTDAMQRGLVVEPKIVSFDFMLRETEEYQQIIEMIKNEQDETRKKQLIEKKAQIDELISGDADITEHVKNNISQKENEEIGKIIKNTIQKKDGRYIVFLPQHSSGEGTETQYFEQQEEKIREMLYEIDDKPEISRLSSEDSKSENHRAITDFENSSSEHLKIMLAINKLNEGVHVDGINGEIMYRKINDGSRILYLQQLGRAIYSLDPDKQIPDEDIPIVYDIYNNYLVQNMNRTVNQTTPKSDLQKLQEIIEWMDKHGYEPDINSENIKEARKAITLKKIQTKYKKYIDGINNPRLSKSDIYEIEQIMELAYSIDLFNMEIGERIIPPGEKDLSEVRLFNVSATQKKFLELYKDANKILGNTDRKEKSSTAKLNDIMNILETLNSNDIFIDNNLIQYGDTLNDVISKCPEEFRKVLQEELYMYEEDYPIGREYNFAKASFRDSRVWKYFENSDVRELYACGIFEKVDRDFIEENQLQKKWYRTALEGNFIIDGRMDLRGLNVKTGTKYSEEGYDYTGYDIDGYDRKGYDREGYDREGYDREGYNKERYDKEGYNREGWNKDGINKETLLKYDKEGYNREGWNKDGINKETLLKYDKKGYSKEGYDKDGYDRYGYDIKGYNKNGWSKDGINKETVSKYDKNGQDINGVHWSGLSNEEIKLVDEVFKGINTASILLKNGIIKKDGQNIGSEVTVDKLLINAGYTKKEDRENICLQLNINANEKLGEKLKLIESTYSYEKVKANSNLGRYYREIFRKYSDKKFEFALLGIIPVSKNGVVQRGTYKGETIQDYKDLMIAREKEREKEKQRIEQKRHISNDKGYNENGEYFYNGKFYMYNPSTGKKADGTYAIEVRNERGFNPDKTYKDTGEYYDENGLDTEFRNREGIDVRYGFGKDEYYYIKQEDGTYINTGLKYNPMGFRADRRHIVTKLALDIRGFTIDGICKRNKDSIYDKNGFKQDGTYQETGELYHNGYNAFGVKEDGTNEKGYIHPDIRFAQGYIEAVMKGTRNEYIKQNYRGLNKLNLNKTLEEIDTRIYRASLMHPQIKEKITENVKKCATQIILCKRKIRELESEKASKIQEIEKYKIQIERLKERIGRLNPFEDLEK